MLIPCSYGEILDKLTILEIKLSKCLDEDKKINIQNEYNALYKYKKDDDLYSKLKDINQKLWDCEDAIRIKSQKKEFDEDYILISENIHTYNDRRYEIKKEINITYHSFLIEEKIYNRLEYKIK